MLLVALKRFCRRSYSNYGLKIAWAEPSSASSFAMELPEISEADDLVKSRNHLKSDNALSCLNRALMVAERVDPTLSESVLARMAFIHQQRGDYKSESAIISDILKIDKCKRNLWKNAKTIARYRCQESVFESERHSILDLATYGVLKKCTVSIAEAIAKVRSDHKDNVAALGVLHLLNGWILLETKSSSEAIQFLNSSIQHVSNADDPLRAAVVLPAQLLLAQCQGIDRPEARQILEKALDLSDQLELSDPNVLKIETLCLLSRCYAESGEAIIAEGLLRSGLSKLTKLQYLSVPELIMLGTVRESYADLLRRIEWNGVKRTRDSDRVLAEAQADHLRCPFRKASFTENIPDWIVQVLLSE